MTRLFWYVGCVHARPRHTRPIRICKMGRVCSEVAPFVMSTINFIAPRFEHPRITIERSSSSAAAAPNGRSAGGYDKFTRRCRINNDDACHKASSLHHRPPLFDPPPGHINVSPVNTGQSRDAVSGRVRRRLRRRPSLFKQFPERCTANYRAHHS